MAVEEVTGDLFALDLRAVSHGANCVGVMGAGIAKEMRRRFPEMYRAYVQLCKLGLFAPGDVFPWYDEPNGPVVYNLASQQRTGRDARLPAIEESMQQALLDCQERGIDRLGVPRIGAGIGGLRWSDVLAVLHDVASNVPGVTLVAVTYPEPRVSETAAQGWCREHDMDLIACPHARRI